MIVLSGELKNVVTCFSVPFHARLRKEMDCFCNARLFIKYTQVPTRVRPNRNVLGKTRVFIRNF